MLFIIWNNTNGQIYNMKIKLFFLLISTIWVSSSNAQKPTNLYSWGDNTYGQLGIGNAGIYSYPKEIKSNDWKNVFAGVDFSLGIKKDGTLWNWGKNIFIDDTINYLPKQLGKDTQWDQIFAAQHSCFATKKDGTLWAWGDNSSGQLGIGNNISVRQPTQVGNNTNWNQIFCTGINTFAIQKDGTLWAWGNNSSGQLGIGTKINTNIPKQVGSNLYNSVFANGQRTFAIQKDSTLWSWGENWYGNLGLGGNATNQISYYTSPSQVGNEKIWAKIIIKNTSTYGLKSNGSIWSWGYNYNGILGLGNTTNYSVPQQIGSDYDWSNLFDGLFGIKNNGTLWTWGNNGFTPYYSWPNKIYDKPTKIGTDINWKFIYLINSSIFGLKSDGSLFSWGNNYLGLLGLNTSLPWIKFCTKIDTSNYFAQISMNNNHVLALSKNGSLFVWGSNQYGSLGIGNFNYKTNPTKVDSLKTWVKISTGSNHSLAIQKNGTLWAWGRNDSGQLGTKDFTDRHSPMQITTDTNWVDIDAGHKHSIAIKSDGTIWSWGGNLYGQLGLNLTDTAINSPTQIGTDKDWKSVNAGFQFSIALKQNKSAYSWGRNNAFQLGYNYAGTEVKNPNKITSDTNWIEFSVNSWERVLGLKQDSSLYNWGGTGSGSVIAPIKKINNPKNSNFKFLGNGSYLAVKNDQSLWLISGNNLFEVDKNSKWLKATTNYALKSDSSLWYIYSDTINKPYQIGLKKNWISISSKYNHTLGIQNQAGLMAKNTLINKEKAIIYPNPANDILYIAGIVENQKFNIINTLGNTVLTGEGNKISIIGLKPGLYILVINKIGYKFIKE